MQRVTFTISNDNNGKHNIDNVRFESDLNSNEWENDIIKGKISILFAWDDLQKMLVYELESIKFIHEAESVEPINKYELTGDPQETAKYDTYKEIHRMENCTLDITGHLPIDPPFIGCKMDICLDTNSIKILC